jgi:mannosyltransferase OCH1-like enzyme
LWTDQTMDTFMKTQYPEFYPLYTSYPYTIQRCDAFRYFVLYTYGGIYLDMDIVCKQSLEKFLTYEIVLTHSHTPGSLFTNALFMTVPKHPFMKYCIDHLFHSRNHFQYFGKHLHVMNSTGPYFLSKRVKEYGPMEHAYFLTRDDYAGDCTICNESKCTGGTHFTHVSGLSWSELDSTLYNALYCHRVTLGLIGVALLLSIKKQNSS